VVDLQRVEDLNFLFDVIRDRSDAQARRTDSGLTLPALLGWLRRLDSATLREYRRLFEANDPKHRVAGSWNKTWGDSIDLLIDAYGDGLDDASAALLVFTAGIIQPFPGGSAAAQSGSTNRDIYDDAQEYLSGLYDTLRYHRNLIPLEAAAPLLDANVFLCPPESREKLAALLTVTDNAVRNGLTHLCSTHRQRASEPPHNKYHGFNGPKGGSLWLSNGALVAYLMERSGDATHIADIMVERKTDDVDIIRGVLETGATSISSGVL
jgi:hypothetical protein